MIETERLTKRYGNLLAVDNLSFSVSQGQVLGFLGPNGAGKSTTMKMLSGFLTPTEGVARICGFDIEKEPVKAKREIGYLPEGAPTYGEMTPTAFLDFIADIRDLRGAQKRRRLDEVISRLHLEPVLLQSIDTLSKGYKRRVGLAQAIIHDPRVLILDEPTDGLDPNQKHEVRSLISEMAADKIIIISTHILEEVHAVCDRAIIIAHGRILADETPAGLEARSPRHNAVTLRLGDTEAAEAGSALESLPGVVSVETHADGGMTVLPADGAELLPAVGRLALERGWDVQELQVESGQLDEVFRQITSADVGQEART
ncbi:MAG: ATP-binding cassette domain-containing protein [Chromatiales bacterium]|jgi:ABC-2 type transport system ATP-binding protein|nr:ATP-binding cassette domain-containing protein [Chromatiales bacterium]